MMTTNGKSGLNFNFEIAILCVKIKLFDEKEYMKGLYMHIIGSIDDTMDIPFLKFAFNLHIVPTF